LRAGWGPPSWIGSRSSRNPEVWRKRSNTSHKSQVTSHKSQVTSHTSHVNIQKGQKAKVFPLHAIVDVDVSVRAGWDPVRLTHALLDGGARVIQLRAKRLPSGPFLEHADAMVHAAEPYAAAIVINDRVDIARLSGAGGVHVGQDDVPPSDARRLLGAGALIGYSTHTVAQIEAAAAEPVSYIAIGPVFGTDTKATGYEPVGVEMVAEAVRRSRGVPVVAIGGITLETAPDVIAAGASSVAIITDLLAGDDPAARTAAYVRALSL
jgi:thiamine-phosphate pyrophosphorylase